MQAITVWCKDMRMMTYTVTIQIRHGVVFCVRFAIIYYGTLLAICFGGWL